MTDSLLLLLILPLLSLAVQGYRHPDRELSQELFLSYEPITTVTDDASIDLDQQMLEALLAADTDEGRQMALQVYISGAFSKPFAKVAIPDGLPIDVAKDVDVFGQSASGREVRGLTLKAGKMGDKTLQVRYFPSPIQESWTNCHVGGNPDPYLGGCFAASGTLEIGDLGRVQYSYDPLKDNNNDRTLQSFSTKAREKLWDCDGTCPYPIYQKYYKYYGNYDYGNQWVLAAFNRGKTPFSKGNAEFYNYTNTALNEAIQKGTVFLNIFMYVAREMEHAADSCMTQMMTVCEGGDDACDDLERQTIHAWDKAVAFYTGSLVKQSTQTGILLYALAQRRCNEFGTCSSVPGLGQGVANANREILNGFREGKQALLSQAPRRCQAVRQVVLRLVRQMTIPFLQGILRYAYMRGIMQDASDVAEAEGATFAASVLPMINACNNTDADILYDNMRVGSGSQINFQQVKQALERNYECLGITCKDIGGLIDYTDKALSYQTGAEPCGLHHVSASGETTATKNSGSSGSGGSSGANVGLAVGLTIGIVAALSIVSILAAQKRTQKEYDGPDVTDNSGVP